MGGGEENNRNNKMEKRKNPLRLHSRGTEEDTPNGGVCFLGFIYFIVLLEGKTSLRLGLSDKITGQGFMKGNTSIDNF